MGTTHPVGRRASRKQYSLYAGLDKSLKISLKQLNPKREGTKSRARYAKYKFATTIGEMRKLGATIPDLTMDLRKGNLRFIGSKTHDHPHERTATISDQAPVGASLRNPNGQVPVGVQVPVGASLRNLNGPRAHKLPLSTYPDTAFLKTFLKDIHAPINTVDSKKLELASYWEAARNTEMKRLMDKGVLQHIEQHEVARYVANGILQPDDKHIPARFVYEVKRDDDGNVKKFKAQFVANDLHQGRSNRHDQTRAPCGGFTSARVMISFAHMNDMKLFQLDIKEAFPHPKLNQVVTLIDEEDQVFLSFRCIDGLKQATNFWNRDLHIELIRLGMKVSDADPCLYTRHTNHGVLMLAVWFDDIIGASTNQEIIDKFLVDFKYSSSAGCDPGHCLKILNKDGTTGLSQRSTIQSLAAQYKINDSSPVYTPVRYAEKPPSLPPVPNVVECPEKCEKEMPAMGSKDRRTTQNAPYHNLLSSLLHISDITRPDIAVAMNNLSRFTSDPTAVHWEALKRVLVYLYHSRHRVMSFGKDKHEQKLERDDPAHLPLSFYVDTDNGNHCDSGRPTMGLLIMLNGDCVYHECKTQKTTLQPQLYAVAKAARMSSQVQQIYFDISNHRQRQIPIYTGSQAVIQMLSKRDLPNATRSLRRAFHEVKEKIDSHDIVLKYIPGVENPSDLLTRPLPRAAHDKHMASILRDENFVWSPEAKG